jgi:antitoxin HicB
MSMERREYDVVLIPEAEGGYSVFVPEETVEEALEMARDAIEGYLEIVREEGSPDTSTVRPSRIEIVCDGP